MTGPNHWLSPQEITDLTARIRELEATERRYNFLVEAAIVSHTTLGTRVDFPVVNTVPDLPLDEKKPICDRAVDEAIMNWRLNP
jgi:hypothetical protein